jgi:hypothetical protein
MVCKHTVPAGEDQSEKDIKVELEHLVNMYSIKKTLGSLTALLTAYINHLVFSLELLSAANKPTKIMAKSAKMRTTVVMRGRPDKSARSAREKGISQT